MRTSNEISDADREMLKSILRKDNDRIKKEMSDATEEIVFELGFEGGGIEVTRFTTADGKIYFRNSGTSMRLDDNDDEEWVDWQGEPTTSFEGALRDMKLGKDMLCIVPIQLHQEYRDQVRRYVEEILADVTKEDRERMGSSLPKNVNDWFTRIRH